MNGWIQTYNDESEKQKKQQQHQNLFTFPNILTYIPFKLDEIYFQKKHNAKI